MNAKESTISPSLFDLPVHIVASGTLYHDAWCTPYLCVHFPEVKGPSRVNIEFWNPKMMELNPNDVVVRANHRTVASFSDVSPEQIEAVEFDVDVEDGRGLSLSIRSAGRCPQSVDDIRPLALVIRRFSIESL